MKPETTTVLYQVQKKLNECRQLLDNHRFARTEPLPEEDHQYCTKVYDRVCKVLDLL